MSRWRFFEEKIMILPDQSRPTSPAKAIRAYCLECCCESTQEVRLCPAEECPLHAFRMGKNPYRRSHALTDEQKNALHRGRDEFNTSKTIPMECVSEENPSRSVKTYKNTSPEEMALSEGKYPTYGNFPEEGDGSS